MACCCKKTTLKKIQKFARKEWCKLHKNWSTDQWSRVVFSDEMNVELDNRKGRVMLRRLPSERFDESCILKRTKQGSGSIGIWACMSACGVGIFHLFDGRLNKERYIEILENSLNPSIDLWQLQDGFIFQQDNASCQKVHIVSDWFNSNKIQLLPWPANSPDLNPIENLWSWLDHKLGKEQLYNLEDLKSSISHHLKNVPDEVIKTLMNSMPERVQECLKTNGGTTRF